MSTSWAEMFMCCHDLTNGSMTRIEWPDGGCYLDQDQLTVAIFALLSDEVRLIREAKARDRTNNKNKLR